MPYQLVLQFPGDSLSGYLAMIFLEMKLAKALDGLADVDGHDVGMGERNIFIITDNPTDTFQRARPILERAGYLTSLRAAYRDTDGEDYVVLWPEDFAGEFTLS